MKHLILLLLLCSYATAYGQTAVYTPFKTNGARWNYTMIEKDGKFTTHYRQYTIVNEDSIVNGITYKKIIYRETLDKLPNASSIYIANEPDRVWGLFREDGMRTYIIKSTAEYLVYDFNKKMGDTIFYDFGYGPVTGIVKYVDNVTVTGELRTRFRIDPLPLSATLPTNEIVTGYGGVSGFKYTPNTSNYYFDRFICYSDSNGNYPDNQDCKYIYPFGTTPPTGIQSITTVDNKQVYPNPFSNELHINTPGNANLYNSMGQKVIEQAIDGKQTINTSQLAAGVYYLTLKDKEGNIITQQKVVKQ